MPLPTADTSRFLFTAAGMDFLVSSFKAQEHISSMFSVNLELASLDDIDLATVVEKPGLLTLCSDNEDRFFNGFVCQFFKTGRIGRFYTYKAQKETIGADHSKAIGQNADITLGANLDLAVGASYTQKIGRAKTVILTNDMDTVIRGSQVLYVGRRFEMHGGGVIQFIGDDKVVVEIGGHRINVDSSGDITFEATKVDMICTGDIKKYILLSARWLQAWAKKRWFLFRLRCTVNTARTAI